MKIYNNIAVMIGTVLSLSVSAQPDNFDNSKSSGIYFKLYGAYGLLAPGSYKGSANLITNEPVRFHVAKKGMGTGIRAGAGIGIVLNEFLNLGIDGEYLMGTKIHINEIITSQESKNYSASGYSLESNRSYSHEVVSIIPHIVFKAFSQPTFFIYTRLGVAIGVPLNLNENYYQHYNYHNPGAGEHTIEKRDIVVTYNGKHTLKPAIGYQFSIGAQTKLSEKLRGFLEISAYSISFDRDKYEDNERLRIQSDQNKSEPPQPTLFDHSKFNYIYINKGPTGTSVRGVPNNRITTTRYAQDPVVMNAITAGLGVVYRL